MQAEINKIISKFGKEDADSYDKITCGKVKIAKKDDGAQIVGLMSKQSLKETLDDLIKEKNMEATLGIIKEAGNKQNASLFYNVLIATIKSLAAKPYIAKKNRKKCRLELLYCIKEKRKS